MLLSCSREPPPESELVGTEGDDAETGSMSDPSDGPPGSASDDRSSGNGEDQGNHESGEGGDGDEGDDDGAPSGGVLLFASGFEPDTTAVLDSTNARIKDLRGFDTKTGMSWENDLEGTKREFSMNYVDLTDGPNPEMLGSSLGRDPEDPANTVLHTWQYDSEWHPEGYWSRVQAEFANYDADEFYYKVRFRIGSDVEVVNHHDWWIWAMLGIEARPVDDASEHSLSVRLQRTSESGPLRWGVHLRNPVDGPVMYETQERVFFGSWQTLEFYARAGGPEQGRIWLAIDGATLVDEHVQTVVDESPLWGKLQPLKVYGNLVDVVTDPAKGGKPAVEVWFDDFEIWTQPPDGVLPD